MEGRTVNRVRRIWQTVSPQVLRRRRYVLPFAIVVLLAILAAGTMVALRRLPPPLTANPGTRHYAEYTARDPADLADIVTFAVELPIDESDLRQLAGYADTMFCGVVTGVSDAGDIHGTPSSRLQIDARLVLKGDLRPGPVEVLAEGGDFNRDGRKLIVFPRDGNTIQDGLPYLFSTRYSPELQSQIVIPRAGAVITGPDEEDCFPITGGLIEKYQEAVANQIPFDR